MTEYQDFEKLHILYSVVIFRDFKKYFDEAIGLIIKSFLPQEHEFIENLSKIVSMAFPSLDYKEKSILIDVNEILHVENESKNKTFLKFIEGKKRKQVLEAINCSKGKTLSKVLNTSNLSMRELQFYVDPNFGAGSLMKTRYDL